MTAVIRIGKIAIFDQPLCHCSLDEIVSF